MHFIDKSSLANKDFEALAGFVRRKGLKIWEDYSGGDTESRSHYVKLRDHISINEQDCLSAYTEKPLEGNIHIDHFRKRSMYPTLTFNYENLLVDEHNVNYGADHKDEHIGVDRDIYEGRKRIFCPVSENLADYIEFDVKGKMLALAGLEGDMEERVNKTIEIFNLNHSALMNMRRRLIDYVGIYRKGGICDADIRKSLSAHGFPTVIDWALRTLEQ